MSLECPVFRALWLGAANYSGKRKVQCLNVQVAATDRGDLVAVSDPFPGARHDAGVIRECSWGDLLASTDACWVADSAYTATTTVKKTPGPPHTMEKTIQQSHRQSSRPSRTLHLSSEELEDPLQSLPRTSRRNPRHHPYRHPTRTTKNLITKTQMNNPLRQCFIKKSRHE